MEYTKKSRDNGGLGKIDIPLLADVNKETSSKYGVLTDGGVTFRGTYIIDHEQNVKHISINDLPVGRNVDEYLRLVKVIFYSFRLFNLLPNMEKSAPPAGNQENEQ